MSEQAGSHVTPEGDAIVAEIHIAAQPDRVFQALTDPRQVPQWWGGQGAGQSYRCTRFESDLRVGGKWRSSGVTGDGGSFDVVGEYLEINPPHLLVHTWVASWTGDVKTVVRWELQPTTHGTTLTIRHTGLAGHPEAAHSYRGWPMIMSWLQAFVEKGETVETRKSA
jgi:uncharacterized protein YndB with AHSA1/START domain